MLINKTIIGNIQASGINYMVEGKDIKINDSRLRYNLNHYIAKILSSKVEIKLIFKIKSWLQKFL